MYMCLKIFMYIMWQDQQNQRLSINSKKTLNHKQTKKLYYKKQRAQQPNTITKPFNIKQFRKKLLKCGSVK